MPDPLIADLATTYGPIGAIALWLWINRAKAAPTDDVAKRLENKVDQIVNGMTRIEAILEERKK